MPPLTVLFAAGDPGGANAVLPAVPAVAALGHRALILDNGVLGRAAPDWAQRLPAPADPSQVAALLKRHDIGRICFATSLTDRMPLGFARAGRANGIKVVCVLDNWMNYALRLAMDGLEPLIPELYAVMDERARDEALGEGVPATCLTITGHPGLASLAADAAGADADWRAAVRAELGAAAGCELIAVIGEPVARDQGTGPETPGYRGYTEATVMRDLCAALQPHAGRIRVAWVPHPRDEVEGLEALWAEFRGGLSGGVARGLPGRRAVLAANRVAGMASILLYEAWLLGRPTISLQPGLLRPDLLSVATRPGMFLADRGERTDPVIASWLAATPEGARPDLDRHAQAADRLAALILG